MTLSVEGKPLHESCAQRLLILLLAVTLDRIRDSAGADANEDIISILYGKSFDLDVFRDEVKSHQDCQTVTQDMIERCRES